MKLWITPKGTDYLTYLMDKKSKLKWSYRDLHEDVLEMLDSKGGIARDQLINLLRNKSFPGSPKGGSKKAYEKTLGKLISEGYILET